MIRAAGSVVALTGAGISVPSGIPDFRTPGKGLWTKVDPMKVAHIDAFRRDPKSFWEYYRPRFQTLSDKRPNAAHQALAELESRGLLGREIRLVLELFRPFERRGQPEVPIPLQVWPAVECAGGRRALGRSNGGHNQHGDGTG